MYAVVLLWQIQEIWLLWASKKPSSGQLHVKRHSMPTAAS